MQRATVEVYEQRADEWVERRRGSSAGAATGFAEAVRARGATPVVDLGCGPGWHTAELGPGTVALDAAWAMVRRVRDLAPGALPVKADLEALPFRRNAVGAAWARNSYVHLPRARMPLALADLHRATAVGAPVELRVLGGDLELGPLLDDDFEGRSFSLWPEEELVDVVVGAGFDVEDVERQGDGPHVAFRLRLVRARSLADTVGPDVSILVCGLNPSLYAADAGIGFARPGNRFWPAALRAGIASRDRDPTHALVHHGTAMTDLVKRATRTAAELAADEYRDGLARVERMAGRVRPRLVCFVGLSGWRAAVDRNATAGLQDGRLAGAPVYVMPSTSGLNTHATLDELTRHLETAAGLAARRSGTDMACSAGHG